MRFPKQEDFAILLMSELTRTYPGRLAVGEVAQRHGISALYLKKIVRLLRQARLVDSKEGLGGGYALARPPREITLWDVTSAVSSAGHLDSPKNSQVAACPLFSACLPQRIKKVIGQRLEQSLGTVTLSQLISG